MALWPLEPLLARTGLVTRPGLTVTDSESPKARACNKMYLTKERYPTVNGREMKNQEEVNAECKNKGHDLICPKKWYLLMQTRGCVKTFSGLEPNTAYKSVRSEEMAYRLHMEKMDKGVLDLEPIARFAPAAYWMGVGVGVGVAVAGVGVACAGVGYGVGYIIQSCKK